MAANRVFGNDVGLVWGSMDAFDGSPDYLAA
jgi:hypothetical protein